MRIAAVIRVAALLAVASGSAGSVVAQMGDFNAPAKSKSYVVYQAEQQTVPAGKRSEVEVRFRVVDGFHVNSHTPKSELLIPTQLTLAGEDGVALGTLAYPAGTPYSFSFDPGTTLDVYEGAFTVKLPVTAKAGEHSVSGTLRYQACDHAACYPPKTLAVSIPILAK
jgi:DsbC/DsbD-like thiol-disulfide interchange protein